MLLGALDEWLPMLQAKEDVLWFKSAEARGRGSCARKLIGCATQSFRSLKNVYQPKVLSLAIALGGHTLR